MKVVKEVFRVVVFSHEFHFIQGNTKVLIMYNIYWNKSEKDMEASTIFIFSGCTNLRAV
jgi:hypothetical protein